MSLPPKIFEDDSVIAFDKPSGLAVSADAMMKSVHASLGRQVGNVHRLETEASGLVLCAKAKPALDFLSGQFQSKTVSRKYLALVAIRTESGVLPAEFSAELFIGPDEAVPGKIRLYRRKENGKDSATDFTVREAFRGFALVECRPRTSQMHQIRFHLAENGAPVVGDPIYGVPEAQLLLSALKRHYKGRDDEKPLVNRLGLHASELTFRHPETKEPLTLTAPLPRDFEVALKYLRRFAVEAAARRLSAS